MPDKIVVDEVIEEVSSLCRADLSFELARIETWMSHVETVVP